MFQTWRFKLREAEEAFKRGRAEKASQLLRQHALLEYRPGRQLAAKVANSLIERAWQHAGRSNFAEAWRDLEAAHGLGGETDQLLAVREELICRELDEAERDLTRDRTDRALARLEQLEKRKVANERHRKLSEAAKRLESVESLSRRAKFDEAEKQLAAIASLVPEFEIFERRRAECGERMRETRKLTEQLKRALIGAEWSRALSLAEQLLDLAPDYELAQDAHRRAFTELNGSGDEGIRFEDNRYWLPSPSGEQFATGAAVSPAGVDTLEKKSTAPRFLLWIDAVGGYFVCLGREVVIGQATPDADVDIPIQGDLSRRHARIHREGENYLIQPLNGDVRIGGKKVADRSLLSDGDEIALGQAVRLRFRKPHALSASARLEFKSRHRTQPWADGILLMAESCVLGPNWHNHVVCRDWKDDVVLFRQDGNLCCRAMESLEIDGQTCDGRGRLNYNSRVTGEDFSMTLEEIA